MVSVTGDEIRTGDVARVNDMASNVSFGRDHELLHAIPQDYIIDQQPGISEPIGMTGSRLEAEVYLVTVLSSALQNLRKRGRARRVQRRGVRAGAAGRVAGGAHPRRARTGLRHRGAGRRLDQRIDLPGRQDPAYGIARCARAACHRRPRARTAGHAAGRRADQGALRRRLRAAGAGGRRHPAAQHAGAGRAERASAGARPHHAHAAAGGAGVRARRDYPVGLPPAAAGRRRPDGRRGAGSGHRGAGARSLRDAGTGRGAGAGPLGAGGQRRVSADGGAGRPGALRRPADWPSAAASAAARGVAPRWRKYLAPVKRWLQDFF